MSKNYKFKRVIEHIINHALSRIYISNINEDDRSSIYEEFKEWIEAKEINLIEYKIIYCNHIKK